MPLPNINHVQQYVSILKDALTGIAALIAALAAHRGFDAWRIQLVGNSSYEVGRQVLRAVSKLRNAVGAFRSRAVRGYEEQGRKDNQNLYAALFDYRWRFVSEALSDLNAAIVEAEAIWGSESQQVIDPLSQKVMRLVLQSEILTQLPQNDPAWIETNANVLGDFTDAFGAEYVKLESDIIRYVRSKMGLSRANK